MKSKILSALGYHSYPGTAQGTRSCTSRCQCFMMHIIYNLLLLTIHELFLEIHSTAPPTSSSTICRAGFLSFTTAAALPIKKGRALSIVSSSMSSPRRSMSHSTGIVPLLVSSLISFCRFTSQLLMYGLLRTRRGRPVKMIVRMLSSKPDVRTASWCAFGAPASYSSRRKRRHVVSTWSCRRGVDGLTSARMNRVPTHTALAPRARAAARDCPLKIPPAAIT